MPPVRVRPFLLIAQGAGVRIHQQLILIKSLSHRSSSQNPRNSNRDIRPMDTQKQTSMANPPPSGALAQVPIQLPPLRLFGVADFPVASGVVAHLQFG